MTSRMLGSVLVAMQFALMGVLAWLAGPAFLGLRAPPGAWALGGAAALLGAWALSINRPGNFNIRPTPREGGHLVSDGPYRWIRHPMYSCIGIWAIACTWAAPSVWSVLAAAALAGVLMFKASIEERWMLQAHPGYEAYRARTSRFVPWLF